MNVEIYNPDGLSEEFIRAEIAQAEKERTARLAVSSFIAWMMRTPARCFTGRR